MARQGRSRFLILAAQLALAALVMLLAGRELARQWEEVRSLAVEVSLHWRSLVLSSLVVLGTYALLIQTWRLVLRAWHASLPFLEAAHVWTVSNLGRYIPGKVWQIAAMSVMAQHRGVPAIAAAGSAVVVNVLSVLAGFAVVFATGVRVVQVPFVAIVAILLAGAAILLAPVLLPPLVRWGAGIVGREVAAPRIPARAIWLATLGTLIAWIAYGIAFRMFVVGVTGSATGGIASYVAVFTASYLAGYLVLLAPGGVVVRESAMVAALTALNLAGAAEALLIALASRLWLTILELAPGLAFLVRSARRQSPDDAPNAPRTSS